MSTLKLSLLLLIISAVLFFYQVQSIFVLHELIDAFKHIYAYSGDLFSDTKTGILLRKMLSFYVLLGLIVGIPNIIYYLITRKQLKNFTMILTGTWLILITLILVVSRA